MTMYEVGPDADPWITMHASFSAIIIHSGRRLFLDGTERLCSLRGHQQQLRLL